MSISKQYFDKELTELTSQDLIKFFESKQIESIHLEFKQYNPRSNQDLFNIILPGITAFLNSEGGLLIFGAPKPTQENKKEFYQGELTPFPPDFIPDKDTIIRKISDNIRSMPLGIKFHLLEFNSGLVAVFEVPQSQIKPHQFNDRYLIRLDGQNRPAPHFLIQALMKEVKFPDLAMQIKFEFFGSDHSYHYLEFKSLIFNKVDSINEKNIELKIVASILGHTFNQHLKSFPLLSYGLPITFNNQVKLTNPHFIPTNQNLLEVAFIFGGDNSSKRISYYKFRLPGCKLKQEFQDIWLYKSVENMKVSDFLIEFPNQNIIKLI